MNYLNVEKLNVQLGGKLIVEDVSLQVAPGEIVGLIGPNGAGKSTLVKTILGLHAQDSGKIDLLGEKVEKKSERERARELAYLPQHQEAHWPLTVRHVVELGKFPHKQPWQALSNRDGQDIDKILKEVDIPHLAGRRIDRLAGGERSLCLLARAVAVDAAILLADEPVADLDPSHQIQIMNLLKNYAEKKGKSVLVVLHDLTLAARFCHRLFMMHHGKVVVSGTPKEVLTEENLKMTYGIEAKIIAEKSDFYVVPWKQI